MKIFSVIKFEYDGFKTLLYISTLQNQGHHYHYLYYYAPQGPHRHHSSCLHIFTLSTEFPTQIWTEKGNPFHIIVFAIIRSSWNTAESCWIEWIYYIFCGIKSISWMYFSNFPQTAGVRKWVLPNHSPVKYIFRIKKIW